MTQIQFSQDHLQMVKAKILFLMVTTNSTIIQVVQCLKLMEKIMLKLKYRSYPHRHSTLKPRERQ